MKMVRFKLGLEKFIKEQLWQFTIVIAFVFMCAWLWDKYAEATMFCISHIVIRKRFDKQYHCGTTALCMFTTLSIAFMGITCTLPISISLLASIPVAFIICWIGYLAQYRIDLLEYSNSLEKQIDDLVAKIKSLENIDLYRMSENELRQYGASKMLSELQQDILVLRVIEHLKISEICRYRNYSRTTIKYHISEIKQKLNIGQI